MHCTAFLCCVYLKKKIFSQLKCLLSATVSHECWSHTFLTRMNVQPWWEKKRKKRFWLCICQPLTLLNFVIVSVEHGCVRKVVFWKEKAARLLKLFLWRAGKSYRDLEVDSFLQGEASAQSREGKYYVMWIFMLSRLLVCLCMSSNFLQYAWLNMCICITSVSKFCSLMPALFRVGQGIIFIIWSGS